MDKWCGEQWAQQVSHLNCEGIWNFASADALQTGAIIQADNDELPNLCSNDYLEWVFKNYIMETLLTRGGVRLAALLNRIFD